MDFIEETLKSYYGLINILIFGIVIIIFLYQYKINQYIIYSDGIYFRNNNLKIKLSQINNISFVDSYSPRHIVYRINNQYNFILDLNDKEKILNFLKQREEYNNIFYTQLNKQHHLIIGANRYYIRSFIILNFFLLQLYFFIFYYPFYSISILLIFIYIKSILSFVIFPYLIVVGDEVYNEEIISYLENKKYTTKINIVDIIKINELEVEIRYFNSTDKYDNLHELITFILNFIFPIYRLLIIKDDINIFISTNKTYHELQKIFSLVPKL
jgi:hypothetical protein